MSAAPVLPAGVHLLERGWLSSNSILCLGPRSASLVDSGYVSHSAQTVALVSRTLQGRSLALLVNTHLHSDHCGGNAALQRAHPGMQTLIPAGDADAVAQWDEAVLSYRATGQQCPRFHADGTLSPGDLLPLGSAIWEVHAAPGHDPHAVLLFEPKTRCLISGDALWERGFGVVFPELEGEAAFGDVADTLDLIEKLGPRWVLPGHGNAFDRVGEALGMARRRLDAMVKDPLKHAAHACKVLIKFKMMEWQRVSLAAMDDWVEQTPYFQSIANHHYPNLGFTQLIQRVITELVESGAIERTADGFGNR